MAAHGLGSLAARAEQLGRLKRVILLIFAHSPEITIKTSVLAVQTGERFPGAILDTPVGPRYDPWPMAIRIDTSARLTWWEKLYLPQIIQGLGITFRHIFRRSVTMQYPEEKWELPEHYRGIPVLIKDQHDRAKCVACFLCEFICPPLAISIQAGELPASNNVEKYAAKFEINMLRCIMCGLCEEVCPEDAIVMSKHFELAGTSREEMIYDKEKLLELGGVRHDPIQKWAHK